MFVSNVGMINNASFGAQQDSSAMMSLTRNAGSDKDSQALLGFEKNLSSDKINDEIKAKALEEAENSQKKAQEEDNKRSFSTFA